MKRVEIVTPRGEVLWVGDKSGMSLSMHGVIDAFQLTVREVPEPVEFITEIKGDDENGWIEAVNLEHFRGRKVRVRVGCVE